METAAWQGSLFAAEHAPAFDPAFGELQRHELDHGAWLDHLPGWLTGADTLFGEVVAAMAWEQGTEFIQGRSVPRPRMTASLPIDAFDGPLSVLREAGHHLAARYDAAFARVGVNLYRDGRDSVAPHGDRIARDLPTATIAIVSLGQARPFRARAVEGGASRGFRLGHGDLLVMGGSFQRTWKHAVPKVARAGPRISVTYREVYEPDRHAPPRRPS